MGTQYESVFGNTLLLRHIFSRMGVAQLKTCRQINQLFHSLATPYLTARAKVTVSVCRFNMYKISYQPVSWQEYFSERVATMQSVPVASLFVQLRAFHSPPTARNDVLNLITQRSGHDHCITWLHLDIEFRDVFEYQNFCGSIFQAEASHKISNLKINFKLHRARESIRIGRMQLNSENHFVKELDLINFPCEKEWDEDCDTENIRDFLHAFTNLGKLKLNCFPGLVKGILDGIRKEVVVLSKLESLEVWLDKESILQSLEILRLLRETSNKLNLTNLAIFDIPELEDFEELNAVLLSYSKTLRTLKLEVQKFKTPPELTRGLFPKLNIMII